MIDEARKVMKWCQRGVRNASEGNSLAAECYGTIVKLVLEIERLNKAPPEAAPNCVCGECGRRPQPSEKSSG